MEDFTQFIKPELLILIPILNLIGQAIKASPIKNWTIPFILGGWEYCCPRCMYSQEGQLGQAISPQLYSPPSLRGYWQRGAACM